MGKKRVCSAEPAGLNVSTSNFSAVEGVSLGPLLMFC